MRYINNAKKSSGFALSLLAAAVLIGCDTNTTTNTNPNPETLTPTGTITGILTDVSTGEPVVGAKISIPGVSTATTNASGQYVFKNVPANTYVNGGAISAAYAAVIDTSKVSSPANANYAAQDTTCNGMNVVFSSQNESGGGPAGGSGGETNSTNHDTPIEDLVASFNLTIGKRSGTITGTVFDVDGATTLEGVNVAVTVGDTVGTTGCAAGTTFTIASTTTAADGTYTISNIEEGTTPTVQAYTSDNNKIAGPIAFATVTPFTKTFDGTEGGDLTLGYNDTVAPVLIATSIEQNADYTITAGTAPFDADGDLVATFTWNESIVDNEYSNNTTVDTTSVGVNTIYNDVTVNYNGAKAGNIAHTLTWNAEKTVLTVEVPAAAIKNTSSYTISTAAGRTNNRMQDAAGNTYTLGTNISDTIVFTTNGGVDLSATAPVITVVNSDTIDSGTATVNLDWLPVAGASSYNVYRTTTTGTGASALVSANQMISVVGATTASAYADNPVAFTSGENTQSYSYQVAAVNSNYEQGQLSTAVSATDVVEPMLTAVTANAVTDADGDGNCETVGVTFNEAMVESLVETASNYTYNLGTTQGSTLTAESVVQNSATTATVTFPDATLCADFTDDGDNSELFTINAAVTDYAGNGLDVDGDVWHQDTTAID